MYIIVDRRELEVVVHDPGATDADLAAVVGLPAPASPRLLVDVGLRSGQVLGSDAPDPALARRLALAVVGGIDSGRRVPLVPGVPVVLGRAEGADLSIDDPTVSRRHAGVEVDDHHRVHWHDLGSRNGTWVLTDEDERPTTAATLTPGAEVRVGASMLAVVAPVDDDGGGHQRPLTGLSGTVPHNRPPRAAPPSPPEPVRAPVPPVPPGPPLPLGVVAVVGPLAMAAVMVVVLGNPAFALFALLSPVLAIGGHLESRRRQRTGGRRAAARWRADVDRFRAELEVAAVAELARRTRPRA